MSLSPTSIVVENCGQSLKDLMRNLEMSSSDLAKTLGVSRSTITRLEAKTTDPSADFLNRLRALHVIGWHQIQKKDTKALALLKKFNIGEDTLKDQEVNISNIYVAIGILAIAGIDIFNNKISITDSIISYGALQGIKKILESNRLVCKEIGGIFEIVSKKFKEKKNE